MLHKLFLLLLVWEEGLSSYAQDTPVSTTQVLGLIVDAANHTPMEETEITLTNVTHNTTRSITPGVHGEFHFELKNGALYQVSAAYQHYTSVPKFINTQENDPESIYQIMLVLPYVDMAYETSSTTEELALGQFLRGLNNVSFKIEIGEFAEPLTPASNFLKKIRNDIVIETTDKGWTRYVTVPYTRYEEAQTKLTELRMEGYHGISIIAFLGEQELKAPLEDILALLKRDQYSVSR